MYIRINVHNNGVIELIADACIILPFDISLLHGTRSGGVNMDKMKALDNLCLTGDIAESWKKWKQRRTLYALASGAAEKDESVQCAILLHMIGEESLDIYNTYTFSQDEVNKMQPLIQEFDHYFAPK